MKTGYVYQVRNKINGKSYIGLTTKTLNVRKKEHKRDSLTKPYHFHKAIRLYDWSNFQWNILEKINEEDNNKLMKILNEKEIFWIQKFDTFKKGYNSTAGGDGTIGYKHTEETKEKMSKSKQGEDNPMYGMSLFGKDNPMYDKKHSEKTKQKMSKVKQDENNLMYGKNHTEETKEKMSKSKQGEDNPMYGKKRPEHSKRMTGKNNPMWGRKHTEESKLKMKKNRKT